MHLSKGAPRDVLPAPAKLLLLEDRRRVARLVLDGEARAPGPERLRRVGVVVLRRVEHGERLFDHGLAGRRGVVLVVSSRRRRPPERAQPDVLAGRGGPRDPQRRRGVRHLGFPVVAREPRQVRRAVDARSRVFALETPARLGVGERVEGGFVPAREQRVTPRGIPRRRGRGDAAATRWYFPRRRGRGDAAATRWETGRGDGYDVDFPRRRVVRGGRFRRGRGYASQAPFGSPAANRSRAVAVASASSKRSVAVVGSPSLVDTTAA